MREDSDNPLYLIGDHLGSTSLVINSSGQEVAKRSYLPFGETWGVSVTELPTDFTYTGQREAAEIGLKYYVARWYDSEIGHFIQADTIVPGAGNPITWNRFAYVNYNPVKLVDPSGHTGFLPRYNVLMTDTGSWKGFAGDLITLPEIIISSTMTNSGEFSGEINFIFKNSTITGTISAEDSFSATLDAMSLSGDIILIMVMLDDVLGPLAWVDQLIGFPYSAVVESVEVGQAGISGTDMADGLYDVLFEGDYDNFNEAIQDLSIDQILDIVEESNIISDFGQIIPIFGSLFNISDLLENCEVGLEFERNK